MNRDGVPVVSGTIDMLLVSIGYHTAVVCYALAALYFGRGLLNQLGGQVGVLVGVGLAIFVVLNVAMILLLFLPGPARRLGRFGIALACGLVKRLDRAALEEKLEGVLAQYRQGARVIARNPLVLVGVVALSAAQLGCSYLVPYLVYRAFGLSGMSLLPVAALQVLCTVAVGFLPLPGSAGAAEGVFLGGIWHGTGGSCHDSLPDHELLSGAADHRGRDPGGAPAAKHGRKKYENLLQSPEGCGIIENTCKGCCAHF